MSLEGVSQVIVEFDLGRDADAAAQDIRSKIEVIRRDLPIDIDPPVVQKFDPSAQPIISLALRSKTVPLASSRRSPTRTCAAHWKRWAASVRCAWRAAVRREVRVFLQPERMQALGVTVPEVMGALQRQNLEVPAGRLERGANEQLVRVTGRITDPEQFGDVIVATRGGASGAPARRGARRGRNGRGALPRARGRRSAPSRSTSSRCRARTRWKWRTA